MGQKNVSELMLRACLAGTGNQVLKFVEKWDNTIDIDQIDFRGMRLAPYFFHTLKKNGIESIYQKRLKVLHQFWWLKTNFLLDQLQIICKKLIENNIEPLLFKGSSVMFSYDNPVLRPMADIDLFIPFDRIPEALEVFKESGYRLFEPKLNFIKKYPAFSRDFKHAITLINDKLKIELDVHWKFGTYISNDLTQIIYDNKIQHPVIRGSYHPKIEHEVLLTFLHSEILKNSDNLNWILDIYTLNEKLDEEHWNNIFKIAGNERKQDILIQGIKTLKKYGIEISLNSNQEFKQNRLKLNCYNKEVVGMESFFQKMKRKNHNSWNTVKLLFPNQTKLNILVQYLRFIVFQYYNTKLIQKPFVEFKKKQNDSSIIL